MKLSNPNIYQINGSEVFLASGPITFKYVDNSTAKKYNWLTSRLVSILNLPWLAKDQVCGNMMQV